MMPKKTNTRKYEKVTNNHIYTVTFNGEQIAKVFNNTTDKEIPLNSQTVQKDMIRRNFKRFVEVK